MCRYFIFISFCIVSALLSAQHKHNEKVITPHADPSLRFTENAGQWDQHILFRAQLDGGALFIEGNCLTFNFYDKKKFRRLHHGVKQEKDLNIKGHAYKVHFNGCNPNPLIEKKQEGTDYENFFLGSDESRWKGGVKNYHQLFMRNLYNGIDYEVVTATQGIKYNFHVAAGVDPSQIKLQYEGIDKLKLKDGALYASLAVNEVIEHKPFAYQMICGVMRRVQCNYVLKNNILQFEFPEGYDKSVALVIDPLLVFAAQSGSTADNFGMTATYDPQGNLYAGGIVYSIGYPTTTGAFSSSFLGGVYYGNTDVVITKYNPTGTNLVYSTYLGGNFTETVHSMVVDNSNNLCLYGATSSSNFPVTNNAFDNTFNGGPFLMFVSNGMRFHNGTDIYVTKLNFSGTALIGSTFLGGTGNDGINHSNATQVLFVQATPPASGQIAVNEPLYDSLQFNYGDQCRGEIQVDLANNIYIASSTRSSNFPVANAFDGTLGGKQDGVICKLSPGLNNLIYSSYIGGSNVDASYGLFVKQNQEVYVTGGTASSNFPYCSGGFMSSYSGNCDGYVIRINPAGNNVLNGTFFGTSSYDQSYFIQADKYNDIYIYGQSLGNTPTVIAPNESTVFSVPNTHQFIARFNQGLTTLNMATKFGSQIGATDISPCAFAVDRCNNIYLSGWGGNILTNFPVLSNMPLAQPTQSSTDGFDFYFMGLDSNATQLIYGSYFGGSQSQEHVDGGTSRFDPMGRIYQSACAGCGGNDDFPVTPGSWPNTPGDPNHDSNCNNGVVKLDFQLQISVATINTATLAGCTPFVATFTNATPPGGANATFNWYLPGGLTTSITTSPTHTFTQPGVFTVALVVEDPATCNKKDSTVIFVTVYPKPTTNISVVNAQCTPSVVVSHTTNGNLGSNPFAWNFGNGSPVVFQSMPTFTYSSSGNFNITFTVTDVNGCRDIKSTPVSIFNFAPAIVSNTTTICNGSTLSLVASGGTSYTWSPGGSLSDTQSAVVTASPLANTIYSVIVSNNSPGYTCTRTLTASIDVLPSPAALFNVTTTPCTNTISVVNSSSGNFGTDPFSWDLGDGTITASLTSHEYTVSGIYNVQLNVTDINGCKSAHTRTVSVIDFQPGIANSGTICNGSSMHVTASGGTAYQWSPPEGLSNTSSVSPSAGPTVTTVYTVEITDTSFGQFCRSTRTIEVVVNPSPVAAFEFTTNPCGGGVSFFDKSSDDVISWQWQLSATVTKTIQNPYHFYNAGGKHNVKLTTKNEFGCAHTVQKPLDVVVPPVIIITGDSAICYGNKAKLVAEGGIAYRWSPPETLDNPESPVVIASPTAYTEYSVLVTSDKIVNGERCLFLLNWELVVDRLSTTPIKATAEPRVITLGESTTLVYHGDPGANITWYPLNTTTPLTGYTVTSSPPISRSYTAYANRGACTETVNVFVEVHSPGCAEGDAFVPNTFTPNGDGQNDLFRTRGVKLSEIYLAVYNRWGEKVFETSEPMGGWDGRYKGKDVDAGVFGYYLKFKCANGQESFKKGNVTLIR